MVISETGGLGVSIAAMRPAACLEFRISGVALQRRRWGRVPERSEGGRGRPGSTATMRPSACLKS
jgi:hypothetical protein